jgi:hypothetical protein
MSRKGGGRRVGTDRPRRSPAKEERRPLPVRPPAMRAKAADFGDWLATPRNAALIAVVGTVAQVVSLFPNASIRVLSFLGTIAFALLLWLAWRQRWKVLIALSTLLLIVSVMLMVRLNLAPTTTPFSYTGSQILNAPDIPYTPTGQIPLTTDPDEGFFNEYIQMSDAGTLKVSCIEDGVINSGTNSTEQEWAQIVEGDFETYWVPVSFLRSLAPGPARTLLPCSNWRWQLQHPGL